jgi:hypothetical protein
MATKTKPQSKEEAVKKVDKHVSPKDCFIWDLGKEKGYESLTELDKKNTGCAHWVAHEKGWNKGKAGRNGCDKDYLIRVKDVVKEAGAEVAPADVAPGNVWVNDGQTHCGIVRKVEKAKDPSKDPNPTIEIEHCSSGQGKVAKDDWAKKFGSAGKFYKG